MLKLRNEAVSYSSYINSHLRGKLGMSSFNKSDDTSLSSTTDLNEAGGCNKSSNDRQRYSLSCHPIYPVLACSDGFLMCILRINSAYSTQPRLIREFINESISLLNSFSDKAVDVPKLNRCKNSHEKGGFRFVKPFG